MKKLVVQVWSDIACPWCYVGKRRLETALARFEHRDAVEVVWRAFELDPAAPRLREGDYAARLAGKYRTTVDQAGQMIRRMTATAAAEGIEMRFDRIRAGNTFDAHRLAHLAAERGQGDVHERLFRAYFTEGEEIGDREVLVRLGGELGLAADQVRAALAGDAYAAAVRAEEHAAGALGIGGVPFFVLGGRYGVSGAQPPEVLFGALTRAWQELPASPDGDAPVCGPDGC